TAVGSHAADARLRRRAHGTRRHLASLGHPVARGTSATRAADAPRPAVRARRHLTRRAGARPRRVRAGSRAAALDGMTAPEGAPQWASGPERRRATRTCRSDGTATPPLA